MSKWKKAANTKTSPRRRLLLAGGAAALFFAAAGLYWGRQELKMPYITASSAVVMEVENGRFLYEKEGDVPRPPASLTKLMSLLLVLEELSDGRLDWEDCYIVTEADASTPGSCYGMSPGDSFTVRQLVAGAVMSSGCDCIQCLVHLCAGDETAFVERMNQKAAELGMKGTQFSNAAGIDAIDHFMTAEDIAILSRTLILEYPEILEFTASAEMTVGGRVFRNTNRLAGTDPRVVGLKTGTSQMGGCSLAVCAVTDRGRIVTVLLDSSDDNSRFAETAAILDALEERS